MFDESIRRIFAEVDPATRAPGCHIMTGPIFVEGAEPGDMLEVRYFQMTPRFNYGSNLQASWGQLYEEFGKIERVTIYKLDPNANTASALYAYDIEGDYGAPGRITHCPECDRQPALKGISIPARPHLGTAGVAFGQQPGLDHSAGPAWRQHRQLADRRGRACIIRCR
jgi:acetamidase/formamidase